MKAKVMMTTAAALLVAGTVGAGSFSGSGPGGDIPDGSGTNVPGALFTSIVNVPGSFTAPIAEVWIDFNGLNHTWVGDVRAQLRHPNGTTVLDIWSRPGRGSASTFGYSGDFSANNSYSFRDSGSNLFDVAPPAVIPSGTYRPSSNPNPPATNALAYVYTPTSFITTFGGMNAPGNWTLELQDWAGGDVGSIAGWTLNITFVPAPGALALLGMAGLVSKRRRRN